MSDDGNPYTYPQPEQPAAAPQAPKARSKGVRRAIGGALFVGGLILGSAAAGSGGDSTASASMPTPAVTETVTKDVPGPTQTVAAQPGQTVTKEVKDPGPTVTKEVKVPGPTATVIVAPKAVPKEGAPAPEADAPKADAPKSGSKSQDNAVGSAKDYLSYAAFSRKGLIEQLTFEGFSTKDATYAADAVHADWSEQAVKSAKAYLDMSSFSRSGLIEQLEFEGYTAKQAAYGVSKSGL